MAIGVSPEINTKRENFFRLLFGQARGYVCIAYMPVGKKGLVEQFFEYPTQLPELLEAINKNHVGNNMYYCPQLLRTNRRQKEAVTTCTAAWADLDTCDPEVLLVKPSISIESSPGRYQALWCFEKEQAPEVAEEISRRIAYKHADDGADRSGWDLTQLLRVPFTYNYKYNDTINDIPMVKVIDANTKKYRVEDFAEYPQVEGFEYLDIPFPTHLPNLEPEQILQAHKRRLNPLAWQLFTDTPEADWSKPLWQLQLTLFEAGLTREEVFVVTQAAACNKYARDGRSETLLWKEVCRAWTRNESNITLLTGNLTKIKPLLSEKERAWVESNPCYVERYIDWASSLGDAAKQYHQAGAFITLSSILAGTVRLPTSFGMMVPNLWFMILADTTLTRKSTAMDIAMDLITEIDTDAIMATDGSIEGLLTALSLRPGRPSIFLRDEFSGLLESITKKDYYAGMPEMFTKLYDGKLQKRILRKETIEVREPVLILFAGGIKNKITGLLTFEHVSSGFMPRFLFITAESDITKLKPLGPPSTRDTTGREVIKNELLDLVAHYKVDETIRVGGARGPVAVTVPKKWDAELTEEAWLRYNKIESDMLQIGVKSEHAEIMTPTYDRLSKSILKASVLLAAARQRPEDKVVVEEQDVVRAAYYGEQWRVHANEVMDNVGKGFGERQLDGILRFIKRQGSQSGVARSKIMQTFHLGARDADNVFSTLEQRGLITRSRQGRTELIIPFETTIKRELT